MMTENKELELYIHIPFCIRKCLYCDFLSGPAGEEERASYVDALICEIRSQRENFSEYHVSSVFAGGGTPSILSGEETLRIFDALRETFTIEDSAEITMEVNPGTVTEGKARAWKKAGINRLSIGLQSADNDELRLLGRIHTFEEFLDTWKLIRGEGFDNVNVDLISALPGQTPDGWVRTLRTVAGLSPEHISAYSLIIEKGTPFYDRYGKQDGRNDLPDEDTERQIYSVTGKVLKEYGYHRYEISNYAAEGFECRHNLGYWERKEYLGLGLGSSSLIGEKRFNNTADMRKYMEKFLGGADFDIRENIEVLSRQDQMEEFMFLGLRKTSGISVRDFRRYFGTGIENVYGDQISRMKELGLMEENGEFLRLTERGTDVSNAVFCEFMFD